MFEDCEVILGEGIRLGNHRNEVDTRAEALHDLGLKDAKSFSPEAVSLLGQALMIRAQAQARAGLDEAAALLGPQA